MPGDITLGQVVNCCRAARNKAMSPPFLFWLTFALRRYTDKEGVLARGPDSIAGIKKSSHPHFPFSFAEPQDVATTYFDFWFRSQSMLLPVPVNIVVAYIGLVEGIEKAISILQKALEMDATGLMTSEIINELGKRDAIPLAYRILAFYCDELSEETRTDIKTLLVRWLELELAGSRTRIDMITKALEYLA